LNSSRHFAYIAFLSAFVLSAQQFPDAAALRERSMQAPGVNQNLEFTREISWQGEAGLPGAANSAGLFQFSNGKFRIDYRNDSSPVLFVMDGEYLWKYLPVANEYTKIPPAPASVYSRSLIGGVADPGNQKNFVSFIAAKVIRSEAIDVDGQPHDCWVTEGRADTPFAVMRSGREMRNLVETSWYDKTLGLLLRMDASAELRSLPSGVFAPVGMKLTTHGLKLNVPLDNSLFAFAPPRDARDTDAPTAPLAASGSSGPVGTASPPIVKRVTPAYPALARAARIQGPVTFAASIGRDGAVKELRVISGDPLLIEAAAAAAKQWIYQPTLLNGSPVEVQTTIVINFTLSLPAPTPAPTAK
jgi:TonB family protein